MILSDLRNYIKLHHQVSLMDASHRFDIEPEALKGMLQRLVSKGCIEKIDINLSAGCGSTCRKCDQSSTEIYRWVGKNETPRDQ